MMYSNVWNTQSKPCHAAGIHQRKYSVSVYLYKAFKLHSILTELFIQAHCHFKYLL